MVSERVLCVRLCEDLAGVGAGIGVSFCLRQDLPWDSQIPSCLCLRI